MTLKKIRTTKANILEPVITDFGTRKVSRQNFSRIVALPKLALQDRGHEATHVNVKLVEFDDEKFIQLTPIKIGDENDE
jgi:hypothetical protein